MTSQDRQNPSVIVIGTGMTGLQLVIKLRDAGITTITVLEKRDGLGGTWRENTYPGVACDVPSHAYTYSFEPNPDWSNYFPSGEEIHNYFTKVFYKYGIDACTRFDEAVTHCSYQSGRWTVKTSQGNTYVSDLLFCATGILHEPAFPDYPGLDTFEGTMFHTARWDHSVDLKGKRIGVIGVGSTAAQAIPELIDLDGTDVTVFQRTPQWMVKVKDRVFSATDKARFRKHPYRMKIFRELSLLSFRLNTSAITGDGIVDRIQHRILAWIARRNLEKSVWDADLREKLTPHYKFGCKRVVINETFYKAIQKPNAHLITEGIERFEAGGIVTKNGALHGFDVIVLATGFNPAAYMRPMEFLGKGGLSIEQAWEKKVRAYRSILLPQFPNFFLMLGPNSPIGNYSVIEMAEKQTDYAIGLIKKWQSGDLPTIEVKPEGLEGWSALLKANMGKTAWASGCQSWYLDGDGDPLSWPDSWNKWVAMMETPDSHNFVLSKSD